MRSNGDRTTILSLFQPLLEEAVRSDDSTFVRKYPFCLRSVRSQYDKLGLHAFRSQAIRLTISMFQYDVASSRS